MSRNKEKKEKPMKRPKVKVFTPHQIKQIEQLLDMDVRTPILNALEVILPDSRPVGIKVADYQPSMGNVLGWDVRQPESLGPVCAGSPDTPFWSTEATHFTIPVRPFKYET